MKYPKLRELIEVVRALIQGPYTSRYPHQAHVPAKRFRGKPEYSKEGCIGCAACALVCPVRAIEIQDSPSGKAKPVRKMVLHLDECHYCGQCSALCTTRQDDPPGIKHTGEFDLAGFDRKYLVSETDEKELVICETCGDAITTRSHLDWISKKLGPLAFSNPTLFISALKDMKLADSVYQTVSDITRADRIKILCSNCRRKATIERF